MDYSELYFSANEQLRLDDLMTLDEKYFNNDPIHLENKKHWTLKYRAISFESWKKRITELGYDINKIKINKNHSSLRQFFYVGEYSVANIQSLDPSWLEMITDLLKADEVNKKAFMKGDYFPIFFPEWNSFSIDFFIRLYKQIDETKLWETFKLVYGMSNYGFHMFPQEVVEYVLSFNDNKEAIQQLKDMDIVDEDGYITVYRGEGERSTNIQKAYSWTLSKDVADRFANFFGIGKIYEAKVKLENIIDYDNEREEQEVLVRYKDLTNLRVIK